MDVYVFGNIDYSFDNRVYSLIQKFPEINFIPVAPNADLPFTGQSVVYILDTVQGLNQPVLLTESDLNKLTINRTSTVHDFDLGFQLKYLKKLKLLRHIFIIGIPQSGPLDYDLIQSIFKKLVEQDIHGS
jgi:hypothetical protein